MFDVCSWNEFHQLLVQNEIALCEIAIIRCKHWRCYYQLGDTTSVWACEDTGAELT